MRRIVFLLTLVLVASACSGGDGASTAGPPAQQPTLAPASRALLAECRRTADAVGYAVPCPTRLPFGLRATAPVGRCHLGIVGPGGEGPCARSWRGWVVGSSETADQHLVLTASPRPLRDPAKVVNGPAWYRDALVRPLRHVWINGSRLLVVYVPAQTNEGSAFAHHVVLIWTNGGHTYAVGFHDVEGIRATLALDVALVRGIKMVGSNDA